MNAVPKMTLGELQPGQLADFFAILAERTKRKTREGKPFFLLRFQDRTRSISTPLWENSPFFAACDQQWQAGQHFKIRAAYQDHDRFGPQLDIKAIRLATDEDRSEGFDPTALVPHTRFDVATMYAELLKAAESIADENLRGLVLRLLSENADAVAVHPAASRNHHSYRGGYLEHTLSVVRTGIYLAEKYAHYYPDLSPPLNRDLIVAGCIVHDIGKIHELRCEGASTIYTVAGHLIGHIQIGRDMVREAARHFPDLNPELLLYLEHIILSHQGIPEWGSPKEPMFPEALLVHFADDIDAKMNMFVEILNAAEGEDPFTDGSNIFRRRLLKGRGV